MQQIRERILKNEHNEQEKILEECMSWSMNHGFVLKSSSQNNNNNNTFAPAPTTLLPTPMPRVAFENVRLLATDFNILVDRVSRDFQFLNQHLSPTAKADEFVRNLLNILKITHQEGVVQPIYLGIHRSDYMLQDASKINDAKEDNKEHFFLQVEINTIAASFGCLSSRASQMHRFLMTRWLRSIAPAMSDNDIASHLPQNDAIVNLPAALAAACKLNPSPHAIVMMIIQPGERNSADQRWLEYQLYDNHGISMIRRSLADIHQYGRIDQQTKQLIIHDPILKIDDVIGVCYYRAGYVPKDYPSQIEWDAVLMMERSKSIKCPSVAYHLAGTKKIQQVLAQNNMLEKFVDSDTAKRLRTCFAGLWSLDKDDDETKQIIQEALEHPDDYVLKPQREGGGNNVWGQDLVDSLGRMSLEERAAFILMKRIKVVESENVLVRDGQLHSGRVASELGIYSTFIGDGQKIYLNQQAGHLLRTKLSNVNEGGVAAGFAVLDSPLLL